MPLALNCSKSGEQAEGGIQPNFILIFCDDMGYGDWERAGHPTIRTPNLNRMADQGVTITQFYCAASVCSPSRAALLTGRYPIRTGVVQVFFPGNKVGLPLSEKTLPELLKPQGYATACIGKWHLGHTSAYLPTERGFDSYFGIPYSNDMSLESRGDPPIPLMRDRDIIEQPCDQNTLTRRYTEESIKFIEANQRRPFFLYLAHSMPHVPLHVSDEFRGKSKRGLYGDVIEEIDWSAGEILRALDRLGIGENTLVIFTSDNGPWTTQLQQGGSAGLLRGAKGSTWEGGVRVPFIARYPDKLPAGAICPEVATTMDMFTTLLELSGADIPRDRIIDGVNILPVLQGRGASPRERFYYFHQDRLTAIRQGKFKLHFERTVKPYQWAKCNTYKLYDLEIDPSENYDIASQHPERVRQLTQLADDFRRQVAEAGENQELIDRLLRRGR
ncbi:sulfatase [candidate division KSB1 bacterium]|nr:sulfatase [candidate division KSB1 bacterium]